MNIWNTVEQVKKTGPLVQCITNTVAANFAANAVIAVGGSPVMASDPNESPTFTEIAGALTVNIGTCSDSLIVAIKKCTTVAKKRGISWVLDPVGVAASKKRQDLCADLLENYKPSVLRGNASEILTLAISTDALTKEEAELVGSGGGKGLDSTLSAETAVPGAQALARKFNCIVAMSGECDFVVSPSNQVTRIVNGHPMMAQVTATGCSLTAVLGCFLSLKDVTEFDAVNAALSYYAVAGEYAAKHAVGGKTGTMHTKMLDYLGSLSKEEYFAVARQPIDLSLYLVTDPKLNLGRETSDIVEKAIAGGATIVQLREKKCDSGEFLERARKVKAVCDLHGVPLLINDRVDIALAVDADGVHIGQSDLPPEIARKLLGPTKIIGLSVSTDEELHKLSDLKDKKIIDYIGVGPVFATATKPDAKAALGIDKLRQNLTKTDYLAVAIGGIDESNAKEILAIPQVQGIAVVTALTMAEDPESAARRLSRGN